MVFLPKVLTTSTTSRCLLEARCACSDLPILLAAENVGVLLLVLVLARPLLCCQQGRQD